MREEKKKNEEKEMANHLQPLEKLKPTSAQKPIPAWDFKSPKIAKGALCIFLVRIFLDSRLRGDRIANLRVLTNLQRMFGPRPVSGGNRLSFRFFP